jgi:hypothetical protein
MDALTDKTNVNTRVNDLTGQPDLEVRRRAGWWATALAGLLAGAAAIGALRWRKARQTPKSRAQRAWLGVQRQAHGVQRQVRKAAARMR